MLSIGLNFFENQLLVGVEYFKSFDELEVVGTQSRSIPSSEESSESECDDDDDDDDDDHIALLSTTDESDVEENVFVETSMGNIGLY